VLHGVSVVASRGAILAVVGRSGSGKSTLAWHFNRLLEPTRGIVKLDGKDARTIPLPTVRRSVGFTFQRVDLQLFEVTVADDVAFGLVEQGVPRGEAHLRACAMLDALGMPSERCAERRPVTLSAGEQRRVALAGVLVMNPAVLVLDEPTSGLDARGTDALAEQLVRLRDEGRAIVIVTHDLDFARQMADTVLHLDDGRGTSSDAVDEVIGDLVARWACTKAG
jgi:energy-coupling factor transporter ATP-binding protein EcfA2